MIGRVHRVGLEAAFRRHRSRFVYLEFNDMSLRRGSTGGVLAPLSDFLSPFGFRFIAAFCDHMELGDEMHVGSNALGPAS